MRHESAFWQSEVRGRKSEFFMYAEVAFCHGFPSE